MVHSVELVGDKFCVTHPEPKQPEPLTYGDAWTIFMCKVMLLGLCEGYTF